MAFLGYAQKSLGIYLWSFLTKTSERAKYHEGSSLGIECVGGMFSAEDVKKLE
jgi:hypothetical protein